MFGFNFNLSPEETQFEHIFIRKVAISKHLTDSVARLRPLSLGQNEFEHAKRGHGILRTGVDPQSSRVFQPGTPLEPHSLSLSIP